VTHSDGSNRSHVAVCPQMTLCEEHGSLLANARLIAAAPDLLAACEAYAAWAATVTEGAPDLRPLREQIRAAIAKAAQQ
jgi:hypothetical protein